MPLSAPFLDLPSRRARAAVTCAALACLAAACGDGAPDAPAARCAPVRGGTPTHLAPHPGGGFEATLRLDLADGVPPVGLDPSRCASAKDPAEGASAIVPRRVSAGYTALLVDPGAAPGDRGLVRDVIDELLARRPADERIAIFRWAAQVTQVVTFTADRGYVVERSGEGLPVDPAGGTARAPLPAALSEVRARLSGVGGVAAAALRTVVVVTPRGADEITPTAIAAADPHLLLWLGPAAAAPSAAALPPGHRFPFELRGEGHRAAAGALSARLDAYRNHGHVGVGLCPGADAGPRDVPVAVGAGGPVMLRLPAILPENRPGRCDPAGVAAGARRFGARLELFFSPEQRLRADAIFRRAFGEGEGDAKEPFALQVKPSAQHAPVAAEAHYRGQSSFGCDRRSYTLRLEGATPRFLVPGSSGTRFHLVSLCLDRLYLRNATALALMAELGLFPIPFDVVELVVDGASQGPYLLTEEVDVALRRQHTGVTAVVRRVGTGGTFVPEVKWAAGDRDAAGARLAGLLDGLEELSGIKLDQAIRARLNLDQYYAWLGLMTLLGSGDYGDEVFFYGTVVTNGEGAAAEHWSIAGWDQDDLFADCHGLGQNALFDPFGLSICAEAQIEKRLFADPLLYKGYVDVAGRLLTRVTPAVFARIVGATAQRILAIAERPGAFEAMRELSTLTPPPPDLAALRTQLQQDVDLMAAQFGDRWRDMEARIGHYRASR